MGVFPARCSPLSFQEPLPHARGGVSTVGRNNGRENCSSPRPWGCFLKRREIRWLKTLFPTPVGVFLYPYPLLRKCRTLPHARGGVSWRGYVTPESSLSSPRPWGCFRFSGAALGRRSLFPTPVGVFLIEATIVVPADPLPHARGGVSFFRVIADVDYFSSPRPWGCFRLRLRERKPPELFPTPVGVFP